MKLAYNDILKLLPPHIADDPQFSAAGGSANPFLNTLARSIPNLLIWARLGRQDPATFLAPLRRLTEARPGLSPLDLETLESLAWQFHVDFREAAKTKEELAGMVLNSIAWHRIKGTPASIYAALDLFGYTGIKIEEHPVDMPWASYQLGLAEITGFEDISRIVHVCREMQPARCRLWRVYNDEWDQRPGIYDGGDPDRHGWDNFWWDLYSGVELPEIPGIEGGLVVSFGDRRGILSFPWHEGDFIQGAILSQVLCSVIRYRDHFIWDVSHWEEDFIKSHGFVWGQIFSTMAGELLFDSQPWTEGGWDSRPWGRGFRYGRYQQPWRMFDFGQPKSQHVHDDGSDKLEPAQGNWHGYDDINNCWDVPSFEIWPDIPKWDCANWDDADVPEKVFIQEQFHERREARAAKAQLAQDETPHGGAVWSERSQHGARPFVAWDEARWDLPDLMRTGRQTSLFAGGTGKLYYMERRWEGAWSNEPWGRFSHMGPDYPEWRIFVDGISRNSLAWDESFWDGLNSFHDQPMREVPVDPPVWDGFGWDDEYRLVEYEPIHEFTTSGLALECRAWEMPGSLALAGMARASGIADLTGSPAWDGFAFDDRATDFGFGRAAQDRFALMGGERLYASGKWDGAWHERPWGTLMGFVRKQAGFGANISGGE